MQRLSQLLIVSLAALMFASCGRKEQSKTSGEITIAVIPKGTTHEFWKAIHAGAIKGAREAGVEIIWKGPLKEDDREAQISVVEDFVTRGVSGIVLAPLDEVALRSPVADAVRVNIPVVIMDSGLKSDDYVSFVATDNYAGGKLAAQRLSELLKGKGKVIMLRYMEGSASTAAREQGFLDAIGTVPGITVVSSNQYGGATTESSYKASENLLSPYKNPDGSLAIDGIFAPNESTAFGMLRALQDGGIAGKVRFVGFDSSIKLVEALHDKEIDGLVLQNPVRMGYLAVKTMVQHLKGEKVEKRIDTGVTMVTPENMDQPENKELLEPDLSRWLD
jgi:ribose transport system substrate-binding protein